jgi:hypothetical protein
VCSYFSSLSQSLTLTVIPILSILTFVDCCFVGSCLYSSLVVARHSSSLVTRRRSSLVVARHSSSLVVTRCSLSTRHLIVSLMRAHTHTLSLLSLSLVDCHCCSWHFRSSPSVLRLPPSRYSSPSISPFSAYVVYLLLLISHSPGTVLYCSLDTRSSALTTKSTWYSIVQKK